MRATTLLGAFAAVVVMACVDTPVDAPAARGGPARSVTPVAPVGVDKAAISGTIQLLGITPPARVDVTPSGMCHWFDIDEFSEFSGDIAGPVTFHADAKTPCDRTHLRSSGPVDGQLTYRSLSGGVVGHWETNCMIDQSLGGLSCDGTLNLRGTDGLDGVELHLKWGPGWWPFSYSGTAIMH